MPIERTDTVVGCQSMRSAAFQQYVTQLQRVSSLGQVNSARARETNFSHRINQIRQLATCLRC